MQNISNGYANSGPMDETSDIYLLPGGTAAGILSRQRVLPRLNVTAAKTREFTKFQFSSFLYGLSHPFIP